MDIIQLDICKLGGGETFKAGQWGHKSQSEKSQNGKNKVDLYYSQFLKRCSTKLRTKKKKTNRNEKYLRNMGPKEKKNP